MAVSRNQDEPMYILEESWVPVWSHAVRRLWISEIGERILLLTDYEWICCTGSGKGGIIDSHLRSAKFLGKHFTLHHLFFFLTLTKPLCENEMLTPTSSSNPWCFFFLWSSMACLSSKTPFTVLMCGMKDTR